MAKRGWDLRKGRPASKFPARLIRTWLGHSLELKGYALRIENMPNPVNRGSNKPAQRKGSQVTSRVARKWIGLADAGEWGRAWLPAQAPGRSRTMGFCEQLFSAATVSPLRETAFVFSRAITPLNGIRSAVAPNAGVSHEPCGRTLSASP